MTDIVERLNTLAGSDTAVMREAATEIERLRLALGDAETALSVSDGSVAAIRNMLRAGGVPEAPFIDDHVRNAIVARNVTLEEAAKVADTEAKLLSDWVTNALANNRGLKAWPEQCATATEIASAIRALKDKT